MARSSEQPAIISLMQHIRAAQRELAELRLAWLRDPSGGHDIAPACQRLMGVEGGERLEQALREQRHIPAELACLPEVLSEIARERVLLQGRRWLGGWLQAPLSMGGSGQLPAAVLASIVGPTSATTATIGPTSALHALEVALEPHASRWVELRERADHEAQARLGAVARLLPERELQPPTPSAARTLAEAGFAEPGEATGTAEGDTPSDADRAQSWLDGTDDATRELTRWMITRTEVAGHQGDLGRLCVGLRASALDGLARPARRFFRLAEGARRLGFGRDMNARMRGESASTLLVPLPASVALDVPHDIRVMQPGLEHGVLSDLSVAQGIGEGLALALISPAAGPFSCSPRGAAGSAAIGGLFAQLRADAQYLRRVDGFDREPAERAARVAALWLLLRARLAAAVWLAWRGPARSTAERVAQLTAAGERALGCPVSAGWMTLMLLEPSAQAVPFSALFWGFELHVALRERFDDDYYINPRVSEVLRGAAARGASLDAAGFGAELGARGTAAISRLLEVLG